MSAPERRRLARSYLNFFGRGLLELMVTVKGVTAFSLITLGVMISKFRVAPSVIRPLVRREVARAGVGLLPMTLFLAAALGLVVIGQTVSLLQPVGATEFLGTVIVTVVLRELGPMLAALLVLSRVGTANVIELGTARALGELEALEALGIDPIHYLVVPRVIGMALGIFALTIYLNLGAVVSGYLWAFIQDVPLQPEVYLGQLAEAARGLDFVLLAVKTGSFGVLIAMVTCYHGLALPVRLDELSGSTIRAVGQSVVLCVLLDALFIVIYLVA